VLYFRAIDAGNKPNPWVEKVEFYIIPYFYETVYFYLACILLFTGSIVYFIIRRNEQQQQKLRSEADIRNTISELQLSSIQSQMNPHFIFNSLNVLIQLIHSSNPTKAEEFAVAFSKLLRNVLEQSNHHFITVEQELANMRSYLAIQSERFQDQFDYSVTCDELLLSRDIPVMLVQPFVENAIIHGVAHASQKCRIDVHFREQADGRMLVTVADDGIGREKSFQINRGRRQQSLGTELVRRKILLLREKYNLHIRLSIDFLDPIAKTGTLVQLEIGQPGNLNVSKLPG
jgi:LytS/YehU family sensor histidine kinase